MTRVALSIIIPVYNVEQYLGECLDSVLRQDLKNCEVICVNDGSTDNSRAILQEYKKKISDITIIDKENGGLIAARNSGIKLAKGEYIYYLDSDDFLLPGVIQTMIEFARSNNLDLAMFNGMNDTEKPYYTLRQEIENVKSGVDYFESFYKLNNYFPPSVQWLYLYRKEFLDAHNIHYPEDNRQEDEPFTVKSFFHAQRVASRNIPIIYHRIFRQGSITQTAHLPHLMDAKVAWKRLYDFLKTNQCENKYFFHKIFCLYQNTIQKLSSETLREYEKGFWERSDLQIMKKCAVTPESYKYYWYFRRSPEMLNWYITASSNRFMLKLINRILVLQYRISVKNG